MSRQLLEQSVAPIRTSGLMLQRKCDCGNHTMAGAECGQCRKKAPERKRSAMPSVRPLPRSRPRIQRQPAGESGASELFSAPAAPVTEAAPTPEPAQPEAQMETAAATESPGAAFLVEDDATELQAGQMRKSEFLTQLQSAVCGTAEAALAGTEHSTEGCPYFDYWFGYYKGQSSSHIERAIHRYAPEAAQATSASAYIPLVAARVRQGVERWALTGEITGVPEGAPMGLPGGGLGGLAAGVGSLFFKARSGGAEPAGDDPAAVQARLGAGKPLDSGARKRMEGVFGQSFAHVRTHTDSTASRISDEQNARAFTVGNHVAFGAGEYRPGTMAGDALIAHEFAHVMQQSGSASSAAPMEIGGSGYQALEENADEVAVGAVKSLVSGGQGAVANMRSGLRLQRCSKETCSEGKKTVSVDSVRLHGSSGSPATHLAEANTVYKKCCVEFTQGANPSPESEADTKSWLGGDTDAKVTPNCGTVDPEEKKMYDEATKKHKLSSRIRVFYVKTFSGSGGAGYSIPKFCASGAAAAYESHVVLQNSVSATTNPLAHEIGHILLDSGEHGTAPNLMAPSGGTELTDEQCKTAYNNA